MAARAKLPANQGNHELKVICTGGVATGSASAATISSTMRHKVDLTYIVMVQPDLRPDDRPMLAHRRQGHEDQGTPHGSVENPARSRWRLFAARQVMWPALTAANEAHGSES